MTEIALHLSCLFVLIITAEASSSTFHHIQVGGPANQITTGKIRIDLPSESFQNLKFNVTPYSLQNQYSPYYDQYSTGYKPSAYSPSKTKTFKPESPIPQISYKPSSVVTYKPLPSIPHPVYSFPQPAYNQPKLPNNQPSFSQPQVSHIRASYNPIQHKQPSYQPNSIVYRYKPSQTAPIVTKPKLAKVSYPDPYQQNKDKEITEVGDLKEEEENTEAAPVEEVKEEARSGNVSIGKDGEKSDGLKNTVEEASEKFNSYSLAEKKGSGGDGEEAREAKILVIDDETLNFNPIDPIAVTTLLPEFVPNIFEEAGLSTKGNNQVTPGTRLEITTTLPLATTPSTTVLTSSSESSIRRRPVISIFNDLTTSTTTLRPTTVRTTTTTKAPIVTTTSSSLNDSSSSSIRRRPVISLFHDLSPSTSLPATGPVTPPGDIGQTILDKIRTVTLTVESILESEEEITDLGNNEKELESEINHTSDEEKQRERRKIVKVRKPKTNTFDQEPSFAPKWLTGRWF